MTDESQLEAALKKIIKKSPERRFNESVDMTVVLKGIDLKRDPKSRFSEIIELAHPPRNKASKIAVIGTGDFALKAKEAGADAVFDPSEIIGKKKKDLKKLVNEYNFFIAQADVLPKIVPTIGPIFGPRNKMPIPLPVTRSEDLPNLIERLRRSVVARMMKDQPVFHVKIGSRDMDVKELLENAERVIDALKRKYGSLDRYLKTIYFKTTMGPAEKVLPEGVTR
ncbi:MAG: 50S ribosomal protein L1 [Thermoproteota archaeon]|nr:MAG: 50S ribosomal protein L1 [Candidatus Korarchaeota archaeon]